MKKESKKLKDLLAQKAMVEGWMKAATKPRLQSAKETEKNGKAGLYGVIHEPVTEADRKRWRGLIAMLDEQIAKLQPPPQS